MSRPSIYLAGPEVFLADTVGFFAKKQALCRQFGFEPLAPLDAEHRDGEQPLSRRIYLRNVELARAADLVIANLSPFRGPSADVGTVWEVGFALALGKPVFGYSNDPRSYPERVAAHVHGQPLTRTDGRLFGADKLAVEDFGLADNLMIAECLMETGGMVLAEGNRPQPLDALDLFRVCLHRASERFSGSVLNP
ncbi:Nucleoside 2-deoxyribosyltransferase [Faunimonas pinastri]|uniref:Nucleoside 2-deoxyribosyltransferase n=1 Tax=Faunimonas pinastri TaxID=1855383 RepID=A0A1H9N7W8_9HYPH|nr:nucleoside 2-deoxyribosyltransferase [Faunimonas pinastri]SER32024.1 Nucleoside 2-deoxyribosyltransferase [Faunimonas pinastri]